MKRSFEPLLVSVTENEVNYEIHVINDELLSNEIQFKIALLDFNGKQIKNDEVALEVDGNSSEVLVALPKENYFDKKFNEVVLSVSYSLKSGKTGNALYYFVKPKDLKLSKPTIKINKIDDVTIEVSSDVLAKNVYLSSNENTFFSDNYFDVLPNEKVIIKLSKPIKNIVVKSLFDTLK